MRFFALGAVILLAVVLGLAGGSALRKGKGRVSSGWQLATNRVAKVTRKAADDSPLTTQLERDLSMTQSVTRWLHWLAALEKAQPSDFPRLAKLAQKDPALLRMVATRWAEFYPRQMFEALVAASKGSNRTELWPLVEVLFKIWPKNDVDGVIAVFSNPGDFGMLNIWRTDIAARIFDVDPERGLRAMADWHVENFTPWMKSVSAWAAVDPRHAAEVTSALPAFTAANATMEAIGQEWAKSAPATALEYAANHPGILGSALASGALKQWGAQDVVAAANWLAQADEQSRNRLSPAFAEAWAKTDATAALDWCQANLSGTAAIQAVGAVMKGAAEKDVPAAAALVTSMEPSPARAEAAVAVAEKFFPALTTGKVKPEAVNWLNSLDPYSVQRAMERAQFEWTASDPGSLADFLLTPNASEMPSSMYTRTASAFAQKDPLKALQWAASLSGDRALAAGSAAYATWREAQPASASEWLSALPADDPRRQPYFEDAVRSLAWNNPQAAEQFQAMTPGEQALALPVVQGMALPDARKTALLAALKGK